MTKEQFLDKWLFGSNPLLEADFEAVIATEIAKVQESIPQPQKPKGNCSTFDMSRLVDQPQPAKPFDRERFEAMFRAVIETHEATMNELKQLDAYYATKEGGANE